MTTKVAELAVDITVNGAAAASQGLKNVEKGGASALITMGKLSAALAAVGVAGKAIADAGDAYTRLNGRIALVTKSAGEAAALQQQLFGIAQKTGSEYASVVQSYSRIALSAKELGATQSQMLRTVESVSKALQVSGSSAAEAAGSSTQFVQALGSGKLRAEELNSLLEGNSFLAQQIAAGMNLTVGGLRAAVLQGTVLSQDVLGAVLSRTKDIDGAFQTLGGTMEQSSVRMSNSFDAALSAIDRKIGLSRSLSGLFNAVAATLDGGGVMSSIGSLIRGGTTGLIADLATRGGTSATQPLVGQGLRPNLPRVTVRANAPKPRGSSRGSRPGQPGANPNPLGGSSGLGLDNIASAVDAARADRFRTMRTNIGSGPNAGLSDSVALVEATIVGQFGELSDRINSMASGIGSTFVDALSAGISTAVQSGSIGEGFRVMGATLIGGLGRMLIDFGKQALVTGQLMKTLFTSLASFIPGGAVGASIAMIAAGSVMVGLGQRAARSSFGGAGRSDGFSGGGFSIPSSVSSVGTIGLPSSVIADGRIPLGTSAATVTQSTPMVVNVFSPDDPTTQRFFRETLRRADARGGF